MSVRAFTIGERTPHAQFFNNSGYRTHMAIPVWMRKVVASLPPELSPKAREKLHWVDFSRKHEVHLAADAAGVCERTIKRWRQAVQRHGLAGLEERSRAPKRHRGPQWTSADVEAVRVACSSEEGRGKSKIIISEIVRELLAQV